MKKVGFFLLILFILLWSGFFSGCRYESKYLPWDPFLNFHAHTNLEVAKKHLMLLIEKGGLRGVRIEHLDEPQVQEFGRWLNSQGVEILGLFENEYLQNPDVCKIFSQHVVQNPNVKYWEFGNEVKIFLGMEPEEYIEIASKVFYYAKKYHPEVKLVIGVVEGSGKGAEELRRMIDAGLKKLCEDGLEVVSIHFYSEKSTRMQEFAAQISRLPISTRIWITEANELHPSWNRQIEFVKEMYPKLRNALRAERIYWYSFNEYQDFALVRDYGEGGSEYSPLMKKLIGGDISADGKMIRIADDDFDFNENNFDSPSGSPEKIFKRGIE